MRKFIASILENSVFRSAFRSAGKSVFSKSTLATAILGSLVGGLFGGFVSSASAASLVSQSKRMSASGATQIRMEFDVNQGGGTPALDILFVVDDSGSMSTHQANLLANVDNLVKAALRSGVDLNAAVITTNMELNYRGQPGSASKGEFTGLAGSKVASNVNGGAKFSEVLKQNLSYGMSTDGSGDERPLLAMKTALSEPLISTTNAGFLRSNAGLAVFILTDADDQSPGSVQEYVDFLKQLKNNAVTVHAAYIPTAAIVPGVSCNRSGELAPARLEEVLNAFGTLAESISLCEADFSSRLSTIGSKYEMIGLRTLQLKIAPVVSSIRLNYGGQSLVAGDLHAGWIYDSAKMQIQLGKNIDWTKAPKGTKLVLDYFAE